MVQTEFNGVGSILGKNKLTIIVHYDTGVEGDYLPNETFFI